MHGVADLPTVQTAIVAGANGDFELSDQVPVPALEPDEILVKTTSVALNPVDTKLVGDFVTAGCIFGFDCAGTVVAVGPAVQKIFAVGDRVCGSASGMNSQKPLSGAFAQYVKLPGDLTLKVPSFMNMEDAAALGTAIASACMVLFWSLSKPLSLLDGQPSADASRPNVLVYGGSTSTGTMVLQILRLCGFRCITTCSPHNFDLVKSYGAEEIFDYRAPDCAQNIRTSTRNALDYAIDCFAEDSSMKFCYAAIGRAGGHYVALNPYSEHLATRKVIKADWILATRIAGDGTTWPGPYAFKPEPKLRQLAEPLFAKIQLLLDEGKIRAHPVRVEQGGLKGVLDGVALLRSGKVSGQKLVYCVA
ncbi:MAG: hypothetical protein Q9227_008775 [Pyrenula ochraceoflavens]